MNNNDQSLVANVFHCELPVKPPEKQGETETRTLHTTERQSFSKTVKFLEDDVALIELATSNYTIMRDDQKVTADIHTWEVLTTDNRHLFSGASSSLYPDLLLQFSKRVV